jgi:hypothetical protein
MAVCFRLGVSSRGHGWEGWGKGDVGARGQMVTLSSYACGLLRRSYACELRPARAGDCPRMLTAWPSGGGGPDTAVRQAFNAGAMAGRGRCHWVAWPLSCTATQMDKCQSGVRAHG